MKPTTKDRVQIFSTKLNFSCNDSGKLSSEKYDNASHFHVLQIILPMKAASHTFYPLISVVKYGFRLSKVNRYIEQTIRHHTIQRNVKNKTKEPTI